MRANAVVKSVEVDVAFFTLTEDFFNGNLLFGRSQFLYEVSSHMNLQNLPAASAVSAALASPSTGATSTPRASFALSPASAAAAAGSGALPATGLTPRARAASPSNPRTPKAHSWSESQSVNGGTPGSAAHDVTSISGVFGDAAAGSSGAGGIENVMDELMVQYLRKRGYHVAPTASASDGSARRGSTATVASGSGDVEMEDVSTGRSPVARAGVKQELASNGGIITTSSGGSPVGVESAGRGRPRANSDERRKFLGDASDDMFVDSASSDDAAAVTLEQYAQKLGLNTESCAANHIVSTRRL